VANIDVDCPWVWGWFLRLLISVVNFPNPVGAGFTDNFRREQTISKTRPHQTKYLKVANIDVDCPWVWGWFLRLLISVVDGW
jgi:hypothetical protein